MNSKTSNLGRVKTTAKIVMKYCSRGLQFAGLAAMSFCSNLMATPTPRWKLFLLQALTTSALVSVCPPSLSPTRNYFEVEKFQTSQSARFFKFFFCSFPSMRYIDCNSFVSFIHSNCSHLWNERCHRSTACLKHAS